ncbi:hypothetical protein FD754_021409, partial [Muntiacus muntjak]
IYLRYKRLHNLSPVTQLLIVAEPEFEPGSHTPEQRYLRFFQISKLWKRIVFHLIQWAPLSTGFSRQEYWSGWLFPSLGDLPEPGMEPMSPTWQADSPLSLWSCFLHICTATDGKNKISLTDHAFLYTYTIFMYQYIHRSFFSFLFHDYLIFGISFLLYSKDSKGHLQLTPVALVNYKNHDVSPILYINKPLIYAQYFYSRKSLNKIFQKGQNEGQIFLHDHSDLTSRKGGKNTLILVCLSFHLLIHTNMKNAAFLLGFPSVPSRAPYSLELLASSLLSSYYILADCLTDNTYLIYFYFCDATSIYWPFDLQASKERKKKSDWLSDLTTKPTGITEANFLFFSFFFRNYCNDLKISDNNTEFLLNFNEFIDRKTPNNPSCNTDLINRVLLDAGFTNELVQNYWSKQKNIKGVKARFVVTDGGITRVYPKEAGENWQENPETYEDSFYKRSLDNDNYVFTAPYFNKSGPGAYESGIMVSKAVEIYIQGKLLKPAVVGIKIDVNSWIENFTKTSIRDPCAGPVCDCKRNSDVMDCVILDDGGFLLMANHDDYTNQIGRFFGEIDPSLMRHLVNISVYAYNKSYDYQSVCEPGAAPKQGAGHRSAYVPSIADVLHIGWWATAAAWSILQQFLLSLTFPRLLEAVEMEDDDFTASLSKQSCITEQTQYFFDNDSKSFSGVLDCGNCSRIFHVEKLMNTNLIFIMVESKGTCPCDTRLLIQAEQTYVLLNIFQEFSFPLSFQQEDYTDCGGVSGLNPSLWSIMGIQCVLLWLLSGSRHHQL